MGTKDERPIGQIVFECGFLWTDDPAQQRESLEGCARMLAYWRRRCDVAEGPNQTEAWRDRINQHLRRRVQALSIRLRGVRKAAIEFKAGQMFDRLAYMICERDRLAAENDQLRKQLGAPPAVPA